MSHSPKDDNNRVNMPRGGQNNQSLMEALSGNALLGQDSIDVLLDDEESLEDLLVPIEDDAEDAPILGSDAFELASAMPMMDADSVGMLPVGENQGDEAVCRKCGARIEAGFKFCGFCGTRYEADDEDANASTQLGSLSRMSVRQSSVALEKVSFVTGNATKSLKMPAQFILHHVKDDGSEGEEIALLEGSNDIGRFSSVTMRVDRCVNPLHCRIVCEGDKVTLEDAQSLNGVFIRLSGESAELVNGSEFRIGEERLCFVKGSSEQIILTASGDDDTEINGGEERKGWGYLRVVMGAYTEGSVYRLWGESVTLGRVRANILFERDSFVSGLHAMVSYDNDRVLLSDLDSSNGTFLRIQKPISVKNQTITFLIGNQLMRLRPRR